MVDRECQNKGIATTTLKLLEDKSMELGIKRLAGLIRTDNFSSEKIFQKNNYCFLMKC